MKQCVRCLVVKPREQFSIHKRTADGLGSWCRLCHRAYAAARYTPHPRSVLSDAERKARRQATSRRWELAHPDAVAELRRAYNARPESRARRRALKASRRAQGWAASEPIVAASIFARDAWQCQLCHGVVEQERRYPDPLSASLDHVIPLARGGSHTEANVQLAHLRCNLSKGARHHEVAA